MNAAAIIEVIAGVIKTAVDLTPTVIKTIEDAKPFAEVLFNQLVKGKAITADQLKIIEDKIDALSAELQQPLLPETDDDV